MTRHAPTHVEPLEPRRLFSGHGTAAPFAAPASLGNILLSVPDTGPGSKGQISEVTSGDKLVRTIALPADKDQGIGAITVDPSGGIQVINGHFGSPNLATYANGTWSYHTFPDWLIINSTYQGGVAAYQNYVYATDENQDGTAGILRFDRSNNYAVQLFSQGSQYRKVSIGLDGLLYALTDVPEPSTGQVDIYDPVTMARVGTVTPPGANNTGVTADAAGNIFVGSFAGSIEKINRDGTVLATFPADGKDLAISPAGVITAVDANDDVLYLDDSLNLLKTVTARNGSSGGEFVSFAPLPAPGSISGTVFSATGAGLRGVTVYADATHSAVTGRHGVYTIANVPVGSYHVREVAPVGYRQTFPKKRPYDAVTVAASASVTGVNFGVTKSSAGAATATGPALLPPPPSPAGAESSRRTRPDDDLFA